MCYFNYIVPVSTGQVFKGLSASKKVLNTIMSHFDRDAKIIIPPWFKPRFGHPEQLF